MSEHIASVSWERGEQPFLDNQYARAHLWRFDGGAQIAASASPSVVRPPLSDPSAVDPEEAFVAALASCHMLWFLFLAARERLVVERYEDNAVGTLGRVSRGKTALTNVTLRPRIEWSGPSPSAETIAALHHEAHDKCFLANSVNFPVVVE